MGGLLQRIDLFLLYVSAAGEKSARGRLPGGALPRREDPAGRGSEEGLGALLQGAGGLGGRLFQLALLGVGEGTHSQSAGGGARRHAQSHAGDKLLHASHLIASLPGLHRDLT